MKEQDWRENVRCKEWKKETEKKEYQRDRDEKREWREANNNEMEYIEEKGRKREGSEKKR